MQKINLQFSKSRGVGAELICWRDWSDYSHVDTLMPDGITWTIRTSAADNNWISIACNSTVFAAVAYTGTGNRVMTTPEYAG
jgi:hypothetical protein